MRNYVNSYQEKIYIKEDLNGNEPKRKRNGQDYTSSTKSTASTAHADASNNIS
jgi:hypothetical protein